MELHNETKSQSNWIHNSSTQLKRAARKFLLSLPSITIHLGTTQPNSQGPLPLLTSTHGGSRSTNPPLHNQREIPIPSPLGHPHKPTSRLSTLPPPTTKPWPKSGREKRERIGGGGGGVGRALPAGTCWSSRATAGRPRRRRWRRRRPRSRRRVGRAGGRRRRRGGGGRGGSP